MAALACPQCKKEVPEKAASCPNCGFALWSASGGDKPRTKSKWVWWVVGIAGGCFVGIIVLGLLATLAVPKVIMALAEAKGAKARADMAMLESALEQYAANNGGQYPENLEVLVTPDENDQTYLGQTTIPLDPWNRCFRYEPPVAGQPRPRVYTLGSDGKTGGEGEDADIDGSSLHEDR